MATNLPEDQNRISEIAKLDPREQSHEEWWRNYNCNDQYQDSSNLTTNQIFKFMGFRTTRKNAVAMDFISLDGTTKTTCFFPVKLENIRGTKYRTGAKGQFIPAKGSDFRVFWMNVVGVEPPRWCRVHKSMQSKLRDKLFIGNLSKETDGKGQPYFKLTNLALLEQAQFRH